MKAKPTTTYVTASLRTWEMIRAAYLSGLSAPNVAARFGVSVAALRKRAQREGWTKRAQADWRGAVQMGPPPPWVWPAQGSAPAGATDLSPHPQSHPPGAPPADPALDLPPNLAALHRIATADVEHDAGSVARKALREATRAILRGEGLNALRLAKAAEAVAKLDELIPHDWDVENPEEIEARHSALQDLTFNIAGELAEALMAGRGHLMPGYLQRARDWRRNQGLPADYTCTFFRPPDEPEDTE